MPVTRSDVSPRLTTVMLTTPVVGALGRDHEGVEDPDVAVAGDDAVDGA